MSPRATWIAACALAALVLFLKAPAWGQAGQALGLIYHLIPPCRVVDTRLAGGAIAAGGQLAFKVVGTVDLTPQGGSSTTGCGIPGFSPNLKLPQAVAIAANYVAVAAAGPGNLKVWASDQAEPPTSVLNYQKLTPPLNIANEAPTAVAQTTGPGSDCTAKANVSATQLVVDVVGYYSYLCVPACATGFVCTAAGCTEDTVVCLASGASCTSSSQCCSSICSSSMCL